MLTCLLAGSFTLTHTLMHSLAHLYAGSDQNRSDHIFRSIWGLWKCSQMIMISRLALLAGLEVELLDVVLLDLPQPIQAVLVPSDLPFVLLDLLQPIHIYRLYIQTVLALQVHLISVNGPKWFDISKNLKHVSNRQVTPRSYPWPTTACSGCSCPSGQYEDSENGPKNDFQYPRIWGLKKSSS